MKTGNVNLYLTLILFALLVTFLSFCALFVNTHFQMLVTFLDEIFAYALDLWLGERQSKKIRLKNVANIWKPSGVTGTKFFKFKVGIPVLHG